MRVSDGFISVTTAVEHPREHCDVQVSVVVNAHFTLAFMQAMQSADVLRDRSMPGDRKRQEQGVEPGVVESLADVAARCQEHAILVGWNRGQRCYLCDRARLCSCHREARPGGALRARGGRPAHRDDHSARSARSEIVRRERPARHRRRSCHCDRHRRSDRCRASWNCTRASGLAARTGEKPVGRMIALCSNGRAADCARASTRWRTGPHCMRMTGWWPSFLVIVADKPATNLAREARATCSKVRAER